MKDSKKKDMKVITIGAPKLSALSKEDYKTFISCLEYQIREFYKDKLIINKENDKLGQNKSK